MKHEYTYPHVDSIAWLNLYSKHIFSGRINQIFWFIL